MFDSLRSSIVPIAFIVLSGSGFVFLTLGLDNSSLLLFLELRFFIAAVILFFVILFFKIRFPKTFTEVFHISIAGALSMGVFSTCCMYAIKYGISPALCSLVVSLQPIVVAFFAMKFLNEEVNKRVWIGLFLGLFGVVLVLVLGLNDGLSQDQIVGFLFALLALVGMSFGSLYQKRYCSDMNLFSGGVIQNVFSCFILLPFLYFEDIYIDINSDLIIALVYMSVFASVGAMSLLFFMIRNGNVSKVSSLFYLLPVVSAIVAYFLLGKDIELNVFLGICIIIISMGLINKSKKLQVAKN